MDDMSSSIITPVAFFYQFGKVLKVVLMCKAIWQKGICTWIML